MGAIYSIHLQLKCRLERMERRMSLLRQKGGPANLSPEVTSLQGGLEPAGAGAVRSAPPARREPQETKEHQSRAQKRYVKFVMYKT